MSETDDVVPIGLAILSFGGIAVVCAVIASTLFGSVSSTSALSPSSSTQQVGQAASSAQLWAQLLPIAMLVAALIVLGGWYMAGTGR